MKHTLRKRFGDRVRALRQTIGLSQEAFADVCGFARSYMSRIERGKGNPSLDAIETLAVALNVQVHELFVDDTPPPPAARPKRKREPLVPYAKDGTCFHPGLRMKQTNRYQVGAKGEERGFDNFNEALAYLRELDVARWRRPNAAGSWSIVKAERWDVLQIRN